MRFVVGLPLLLVATCSVATAAPTKSKPVAAPQKSAPPAFEPKAHALLKKVFDHYRALRSYSGTTRWAYDGPFGEDGVILNIKGNLEVRVAQPKIFLDRTEDLEGPRFRFWDDGEIIYEEMAMGHPIRLHHIFLNQDMLWGYAFASDFGIRALLQNRNPLQPYGSYIKSIAMAPASTNTSNVSKTKVTDEAHIVVQLKAPQATAQIDYFIGIKTLSLHAMHLHQVVNGKTLDQKEEYLNVAFNPVITAQQIEPGADTKALADELDKKVMEKYPTPTPSRPASIPGMPNKNFPTDNGE